jgi:hypothetical protein
MSTNVYIVPDKPLVMLDVLLIFEICVVVSLLYLFFWDIIQELYYFYMNSPSLTNADKTVIEQERIFLSEFNMAKDTFVFYCDNNDRLMIGLKSNKTSTLISQGIPALTLGNQQIYNCSSQLRQLNDYVSRPSV